MGRWPYFGRQNHSHHRQRLQCNWNQYLRGRRKLFRCVTIQDGGGSMATAGGSIKVVDAALGVLQTYTVTATAGNAVTARLATFSDADPNGAVADYTASNWGDGHKSSGTITVNSSGGFDVTGTNTY